MAEPMTEFEMQELREYLEPLSRGTGGFAYESDNRIARLLATVDRAMHWEDVDDEWTEAIKEAHPTRSGSHGEYAMAMKMVGHRHSKGELVSLVNWLLLRLRKAESGRSRK